MATWDDVARIALGLPETTEEQAWGHRHWKVRGKGFVWERQLRKSDLAALGEAAPEGPILGARVEHVIAKEALLADPSGVFFTIPHFDGFNAVLVLLDRIGLEELDEVVVEAWLCRAPRKLAQGWIADHASSSDP
jgi:hypothetical protein